MVISKLLKKVPLFAHLQPEDLDRLAGQAEFRTFRAGDIIIREGTMDDLLFVVVEGKVRVVTGLGKKNEKTLLTLGPHSYFGEMALIDERSRSASVEAVVETRTIAIGKLDFQKEVRQNPELALDFLRTMSWRLRAMNKIILQSIGAMTPICAHCHKIRESDHSWIDLEAYIEGHADMETQYSICPACTEASYPHFVDS